MSSAFVNSPGNNPEAVIAYYIGGVTPINHEPYAISCEGFDEQKRRCVKDGTSLPCIYSQLVKFKE